MTYINHINQKIISLNSALLQKSRVSAKIQQAHSPSSQNAIARVETSPRLNEETKLRISTTYQLLTEPLDFENISCFL